MGKASDSLARVKKKYSASVEVYVRSPQFLKVAKDALVNFIKRVQRGLMPDLSKIPPFKKTDGKSSYIELRQRFRSNLSDKTKPTKSNATATGQMLESFDVKINKNGFTLFPKATSRSKELDGSSGRLKNNKVAEYYSKDRPVFELSEPERQRIVRQIKKDLINQIKRG